MPYGHLKVVFLLQNMPILVYFNLKLVARNLLVKIINGISISSGTKG